MFKLVGPVLIRQDTAEVRSWWPISPRPPSCGCQRVLAANAGEQQCCKAYRVHQQGAREAGWGPQEPRPEASNWVMEGRAARCSQAPDSFCRLAEKVKDIQKIQKKIAGGVSDALSSARAYLELNLSSWPTQGPSSRRRGRRSRERSGSSHGMETSALKLISEFFTDHERLGGPDVANKRCLFHVRVQNINLVPKHLSLPVRTAILSHTWYLVIAWSISTYKGILI